MKEYNECKEVVRENLSSIIQGLSQQHKENPNDIPISDILLNHVPKGCWNVATILATHSKVLPTVYAPDGPVEESWQELEVAVLKMVRFLASIRGRMLFPKLRSCLNKFWARSLSYIRGRRLRPDLDSCLKEFERSQDFEDALKVALVVLGLPEEIT